MYVTERPPASWCMAEEIYIRHSLLAADCLQNPTPMFAHAVYAVGFIARPVGSVIFGHIGDTRGRRLNLLLTISIMAVPTVLIGCLPTFAQIGIAAPALLAVLRLIQGLAMGGEFGSAMVYLHEIAPDDMQGMIGSLGFVSAMFGCMTGVLIVVIMEAIFNTSQMLVFGWRIPFLLSSVSASAAIALRMHMPEPDEFVQDRQTVIHRKLERIASRRSSGGLGSRKFSSSFRIISNSFGRYLDTHESTSLKTSDYNAPTIPADKDADTDTAGTGVARRGVGSQDLEQGTALASQQHVTNTHPTDNNSKTNLSVGRPHTKSLPYNHRDDNVTKTNNQTDDITITLSATDLPAVPESRGEYVPVIRLLRHHTPAVLLQFLFEAWVSVGFWVITTWLPLQMQKAPLRMPQILTQAMLIVNLALMGGIQLASGWLSDKGVPRIWLCFGVFTVATGISCPVLLALPTASFAGAWLLHTLLMMIMACVLGVIPATLSCIYPPTVRATGFNLGHNMAMSWLGGVSPTIVTALVAATGKTFLAPGVLLTVSAGISMLAALVLAWYAPQANGNIKRDAKQASS
eukprot:GHUV01017861.1.p1 GENE.GHUV01017861.1~~GHUV01017861.1.p1  ORF type:complete len:573 (+),score=108.97 GHUV01017861.1:493-2211(+)